jgi:uncharacterized protein YcfL
MKKEVFSSMVLVLGIFLTVACSKENGVVTEPDSLIIVDSHLDFNALGGQGIVVVEANKPVEALSNNQDWVSSIDVEGNVITFDVSLNNTISERTAIITITAGEATESVKVKQGMAVFEVSTSDINFTEQGGRRAIEVKTNLTEPYQVEVESDWLTYQIEGDSLILTASSSEVKREAKVNLSLCGRIVGFTVNQIHIAGYYLLNSMDLEEKADGTFVDWKHPKSPFNVTLKAGEEKETYILTGRFPANEYSILCTFKEEKLVIHAGQQVGETPGMWEGADPVYFHLFAATRSPLSYYDNPEASYVAPLVIKNDVISFTFTDGGGTRMNPVDGIAVKSSRSGQYPNNFFKVVLTQDPNPNPDPDPNPGEGGIKPLK